MKPAFAWAGGALLLLALTSPVAAELVTVEYTATVATVAGNPFGLDSTARLSRVTGSFTYDTSTPDVSPADPIRGNYAHTANGAFSATVVGKGVDITGSSTPYLQIENFSGGISDTFRFIDGPRPVGPSGGIMSFNGTPNANVRLFIAISDGTGATFANDGLPTTFPFTSAPFPPHTFSLSDSGGTLLMQFDSISQVEVDAIPEPSTGILVAIGGIALGAWRLARRRWRLVNKD